MEETIWTLPPSTQAHQHCCTAWRRKQMTSSHPLKSLLRIKRNMPKWWRKWMTYTKFKQTRESAIQSEESTAWWDYRAVHYSSLPADYYLHIQHRKRHDASRLHCHGNCRLETLRVPTTECRPYPREGNQRGDYHNRKSHRSDKGNPLGERPKQPNNVNAVRERPPKREMFYHYSYLPSHNHYESC